ncbi:hypothetical protein [Streptomyces sp. NPDC057301]|uniref:hypothetical protein n=1 Tax=Streptomyces sp. NPDC057301 TaxID=3346093 RepID=UPI003641B83B
MLIKRILGRRTTLGTVWHSFFRHVTDDQVLPGLPEEDSPVNEDYECLIAVLQGGTLEQLTTLLRKVVLEPSQREELLEWATLVTVVLAIRGWSYSRTEPGDRRRSRMTTAGLACQTSPEAAGEWLLRCGLRHADDASALADVVGSRDAAWLEDFARRLAESQSAPGMYPLIMVLVRDKGVTVEATVELAVCCLSYHASSARTAAECATEEAILTRLRQDPLAPALLPLLAVGHDSTESEMGRTCAPVPFAAEKVLAVAARVGLIERRALIGNVPAALGRREGGRVVPGSLRRLGLDGLRGTDGTPRSHGRGIRAVP